MFEYRAKVIKVIDGDTIDVEIDLGFDTYRNQRLRLAHIDTPEIRTKEINEKIKGINAKNRVSQLIYGMEVTIKTIKDTTEKYGRYLAQIWLDDGRCVNDVLIEEKLAVAYRGGRYESKSKS